MSGFELVICEVVRCCYQFDDPGAALSHEKGEPTPNSTRFGLKPYEGVLDVSARNMVCGTAVFINFTRSYIVFPVIVETSSHANFFILFFSWVPIVTLAGW